MSPPDVIQKTFFCVTSCCHSENVLLCHIQMSFQNDKDLVQLQAEWCEAVFVTCPVRVVIGGVVIGGSDACWCGLYFTWPSVCVTLSGL